MPADRAWYGEFIKAFPSLFTTYGIKPNPVDLKHGMESIQPGMDELKVGQIGCVD